MGPLASTSDRFILSAQGVTGFVGASPFLLTLLLTGP